MGRLHGLGLPDGWLFHLIYQPQPINSTKYQSTSQTALIGIVTILYRLILKYLYRLGYLKRQFDLTRAYKFNKLRKSRKFFIDKLLCGSISNSNKKVTAIATTLTTYLVFRFTFYTNASSSPPKSIRIIYSCRTRLFFHHIKLLF